MAGQLEGRVAIVTGGASGIGRATVLALSRSGAAVAVFDCDAEGAAAAARAAHENAGKSLPLTVDLAGTFTKYPAIIILRLTWMRGSTRPASPATRKSRSSGRSGRETGLPRTRWRGRMFWR